MAEYNVNRGIGKPAEFKGLKSQYLFIFAGGLLAVFVVFAVMSMAGVSQWICIGFGITAASVLVYGTFYLNKKYGEHGLMKRHALRNHPRFIINRIRISRLLFVFDEDDEGTDADAEQFQHAFNSSLSANKISL